MHDKVLIVDFGSPGHAAHRAARARGRASIARSCPFQNAEEAFARVKPKAVILSGGPPRCTTKARRARRRRSSKRACRSSASATASRRWRRSSAARSRAGITANSAAPKSTVTERTPLFEGVWARASSYPVWMSHGDRVTELPHGFTVHRHVARTRRSRLSPTTKRKFYATQFHPEVVHTPRRREAACELRAQDRRPERRLDHGAPSGRGDRQDPRAGRQGPGDLRAVGRRRLRRSPRVLIHEAIGDQLTCVFVDHGLMRLGEARRGRDACSASHYNIPLVHVDAPDAFLDALERRRGPGGKAQDHRQDCSSTCSSRRPRRLATAPISSRRARSIPDVIESVSFTGGPRSPSSRTTMSAACPSA